MKRLTDFLEKIHAERWLWCIIVAASCWTDIADYRHMVYTKKLCIWIVLGLCYAVKEGCAKRGNRILTSVCVMFGGIVSVFYIKTNYFADYIYYNYTLGALSVVLFLQYGLLIKKIMKNRKLPNMSLAGILAILMILYTQFSPPTDKSAYLVMFFILFPYVCMELEEPRRKDIFTGIVDGVCVGFIICQAYTFMYRPYVLTENGSRFKSYRDYCTTAGVSYLQFYIGCLLRYIIWFKEGQKKWLRKLFFGLAALSMAFIYMTGCRMPLLGALVVTAMLFAWIYIDPTQRYRGVSWAAKCVWIATLSLMLFPVAYAGTRYLPMIINKPDLQDSVGNRSNSFATVHLKQSFLHDGEWTYWSVMEGDPRDSVKYVTFVECVGDTLCRVIPGLDDLLFPAIADDIFEDKVIRAAYLRDNGDLSDLSFCEVLLIYCETYGQAVPDEYEKLVEENLPLLELLDNSDVDTGTEPGYGDRKMLSSLLTVYASDEETNNKQTVKFGKGDTPDTAWFESESSYTSMQLRQAIHVYTLGKLNLFGHKRKAFKMYYVKGEDYYIGNPHNIFLTMGYEYGVPAMLLMAGVFILLTCESWKKSRKKGVPEYLIPAALIVAFSVYGWFEAGFTFDNSYSTLIVLCAVLWRDDILFKRKIK